MYKLILFLGICSAFASGSEPPAKRQAKLPAKGPAPDCHKIVGCYYINNENEQVDETLNIEMIDVSLCTHLVYSSVELEKNGSVHLVDEYTDIGQNGFQRINDLRKKNKNLKTLVSVMESYPEPGKSSNKIFSDPKLREKIVNNIVNFLQKYKFNGIEIQPLNAREHDAVFDKQNFVLLLKALKEKFDKKGLILSLTVDPRESTAKKYDIKGISKYLSFINLRAYYFYGDVYKDEKILKAGHIAPLYYSPKENTEHRKLNVDYIVRYWLSSGVPPSKLILGTTFDGLDYTLANPKQFGRDAPIVDTKKYSIPTSLYYYTCQVEKKREWTHFYDKEQQVPYLLNGKEMIAYDDVDSIRMKAEYANKMQLGGVFADSIQGDDFSGHCGESKKKLKFPLLKTLNQVIRGKC